MTTVAENQAKGSAAKVTMDLEDSYGDKRAVADRRPINRPFVQFNLRRQRPRNKSAVIRGNRNPSRGFLGNIDVSGDAQFPFDFILAGFDFMLAIGVPASKESIWTDDVMVGAPTMTISGGNADLSVGQPSAAVGDRVIYENAAGTRFEAFITAVFASDDTSFQLALELDGATNAPDVTDATVIAIVSNLITGTAGTVTISNGVMTTSEDHSAEMTKGRMVIFNTNVKAKIEEVLSTTTYRLSSGVGFWPADAAGVDLEAIEELPFIKHVFKIDPVDSPPSAMYSQTLQDMANPITFDYVGVKPNTLGITLDAVNVTELMIALGLQGADEETGYTAYEAGSVGDVSAGANTGNGTVENHGAKPAAVTETITLTATSPTNFNVSGSVSGSMADATVGSRYSNDQIHFKIEVGSVAFQAGDSFTFAVTGMDEGALELRTGQFDIFEATIKEGENLVTSNVVKRFVLNLNGNHDGDSFVIGGGGKRIDLPEGIAGVGGEIEYIFKNADIQDVARSGADSALEVTIADSVTNNKCVIRMKELNYSEASPDIDDPGGISQTLEFRAFWEESDDDSAIVVELTNQQFSYAL